MEKVKKQAKIWLCIGIALMLLASIVVSAVQTNGGKVDMQELMFETDQIVTGTYNDEKRRTPYGVYSVYTKCEDYTMKTPEYSTKCKYFMRISFEGIGFHDLSRTVYGGDTYINNGSHGCINMPYDKAAELYNIIYVGMPVYVHG